MNDSDIMRGFLSNLACVLATAASPWSAGLERDPWQLIHWQNVLQASGPVHMLPSAELQPPAATVKLTIGGNSTVRRGMAATSPGSASAAASGGGLIYAQGASVFILPGTLLTDGMTGGAGGLLLGKQSSVRVADSVLRRGVAWDGPGGCLALQDDDSG